METKKYYFGKAIRVALSILLVLLLVPAAALTNVKTALGDTGSNQSETESADQGINSNDVVSSATAYTNDSYKSGTAYEGKVTHSAEWSNKDDSGNIQAYDTADLNVQFDTNPDKSTSTGDGEFYTFFLDVSGSMFKAGRFDYIEKLLKDTAKNVTDRNPNARFGFQCYTYGAEKNSYEKYNATYTHVSDIGQTAFWPLNNAEYPDENFDYAIKKKITDRKSVYEKDNSLTMYTYCMDTFRSFLNWYILGKLNKKKPVVHCIWITDGTAPKVEDHTQTPTNISKYMVTSGLTDFFNPAGTKIGDATVKGELTYLQVLNGEDLSQWSKAVIGSTSSENQFIGEFGKGKLVTENTEAEWSSLASSLSRPLGAKDITDTNLKVNIDKTNFRIDSTKQISMPGFSSSVTESADTITVTFTPDASQDVTPGGQYSAYIPLLANNVSGDIDVVKDGKSSNLSYKVDSSTKQATPAKIQLNRPAAYKVNYDFKSGGGINPIAEESYPKGQVVSVKSGSGLGTADGGAFGGWLMTYTEGGVTKTQTIDDGGTFVMPSTNVTLSALYSKVDVILDGSQGTEETYLLSEASSATANEGILETAIKTKSVTASQISEISFTQNQVPSSYKYRINLADSSSACPVYAYLIEDGTNYKLQVDAPGTIKAKANSLVSLFGGDYSTSSTIYNNGFINCAKVDIQNLDASAATSAYRMFCDLGQNLSSNTTITLPDSGLDTSKVTNMSYFLAYSSIASFDFTKISSDSATSMYCFLSRCSKLESIDLRSLNTKNNKSMNSFFYRCSGIKNNDLHMASDTFDTSNCEDFRYLFYGCSSLTKLHMDAYNTSSATQMDYMFEGCSELTELTFPSTFSTEKVTSMEEMFRNCSNVSSLDVSMFRTSLVESFSMMFDGCNKVQSFDLSDWGTNKSIWMNAMFQGCSSAASIDLPDNFVTSNCKSIGYMFNNCSSVTRINVYGWVVGSNIVTSGKAGLKQVFNNCKKLERIICSDKADWTSVSSTESSENMFGGCEALVATYVTGSSIVNITYNAGKVDKNSARVFDGINSHYYYFTNRKYISQNEEENSFNNQPPSTNILASFSDGLQKLFSPLSSLFNDSSSTASAYADENSFDSNEQSENYFKQQAGSANSAIIDKGVVSKDGVVEYIITVKNVGDFGSKTNNVYLTDDIPAYMNTTDFVPQVDSVEWIPGVENRPAYASLSGSIDSVVKTDKKVTFTVHDLAGQSQIKLHFMVVVTDDANSLSKSVVYYDNFVNYKIDVVPGNDSVYYPISQGISNYVRHYSGTRPLTSYTVSYQNAEGTPAEAPPAPDSAQYASGTTVLLPVIAAGSTYQAPTFWRGDTQISGGSFTMPSEDVVVTIKYVKKSDPVVPKSIAVEYGSFGLDTGVVNPTVSPADNPKTPPLVASTSVKEGAKVSIPSGLTCNNYHYLYDEQKSKAESTILADTVKVELLASDGSAVATYSPTTDELKQGSFTTPELAEKTYDKIKVSTAWERFQFNVKYVFVGDAPTGATKPDDQIVKWDDSFALHDEQQSDITESEIKYTFEGWYHNPLLKQQATAEQPLLMMSALSNNSNDANDTVKYIMPSKDVVVQGSWTPTPDNWEKYSVKVENGTATINNITDSTFTDSVCEGDAIKVNPTVPTGYECNSLSLFYLDQETKTEETKIPLNEYEPMQNNDGSWDLNMLEMTVGTVKHTGLYIRCNVTPKKMNVTFDANKGQFESASETQKVIEQTFGEDYKIPSPSPTREGYTFTGWFTEKDGGTRIDNPLAKVSRTEDHTVYAGWKANEYDLTINYKFEDGKQAYTPYNAKVPCDSTYSVTSPTITDNPALFGFSPFIKDGDNWIDATTVTGKMPASDKTIDVIYRANGHKLTLNYLFTDGSTASESKVIQMQYNETYYFKYKESVYFPEIEGAEPITSEISGTMLNDDRTENVFYDRTTLKIKADPSGYNGLYDGQPHSISAEAEGVAEGTEVTFEYSTNQTEWSTTNPACTNVDDSKTVYVRAKANGYKTSPVASAVIKINKRTITLTIPDDKKAGLAKTYDGSDLSIDFQNNYWKTDGLVSGEEYYGTLSTNSADANTYSKAKNNLLVKDETPADKKINTNNYNIVNNVELTINKATLKINTISTGGLDEKVYDGKIFACSSKDKNTPIEIQNKVATDDIEVKLATYAPDVNNYNTPDKSKTNHFTYEVIFNCNKDNYTTPSDDDFNVSLIINKATISTNIDMSVPYNNGNPVSYTAQSGEISGLVEGETISIVFTTNAGESKDYFTEESSITTDVTWDTAKSSNYNTDLNAKITILAEGVIPYEATFSSDPKDGGKTSITSSYFESSTNYKAGKNDNYNTVSFTKGAMTKSVKATANAGYEFDYWTVGGKKLEPDTGSSISSDVQFVAHFKLEEKPSMTISKTAKVNDGSKTKAQIDDSINYVITIKNDGNVKLQNIQVRDDLLWGSTKRYVIEELAAGSEHVIPVANPEYPVSYLVKQDDFADSNMSIVNTAQALCTYGTTSLEEEASVTTQLQLTSIPVPKPIEGPDPVGKKLIYNGAEQWGVTKATKNEYTLNNDYEKDVDVYTAQAILNPGYIWVDNELGVKNVEWEIIKAKLTIKTTDSKEYDGTNLKHFVDPDSESKKDVVTGLVGDEKIDISQSYFETKNPDAATYTYGAVYEALSCEGQVKLQDSKSLDNYDPTYVVTLTIDPKDISEDPEPPVTPPDITVDFLDGKGPNFTYHDELYSPKLQVNNSKAVTKTLIEGTDYSTSGEMSGTDVKLDGQYVVPYVIVITGQNNYTGTRLVKWYINRKDLTVTPKDATKTYNENPQTLNADEVTAEGLCDHSGQHVIDTNSVNFDKTLTNVGSLSGIGIDASKLTISKPDKPNLQNNYNIKSGTATLKITPFQITIQIKGHTSIKDYNRTLQEVQGYDASLKDASDANRKYYNIDYMTCSTEAVARGENVQYDHDYNYVPYYMQLNQNHFGYNYPNGNVQATFEVEDGWLLITPLSLKPADIILDDVVRKDPGGKPQKQEIDSVITYTTDGEPIPVYPDEYTVTGDESNVPGSHELIIHPIPHGNFIDDKEKPWAVLGDDDEIDDIGENNNGEVHFFYSCLEGAPETALHENESDMIENTVTANELSDVCRGNKINVFMNVKDANQTISPESKALFEQEMNRCSLTLGTYMDININKVLNSSSGSAVNDTLHKVELEVSIPEKFLPEEGKERSFYILRNHDGAIEDMKAVYNQDDGTLTFSSDKFSDYALTYTDAKDPVPPTPQPDPKSDDVDGGNPTMSAITADNAFVAIALIGITVISMFGFALLMSRRYRSRRIPK